MCIRDSLTTSVTIGIRGADDPLLWWAGGPRAMGVKSFDSLWLRLIDVDAALTARGYSSACDVVLDVVDPVCPWNQRAWRLTVGPDGVATCLPTSRGCLLYTSPSPRDRTRSRMPSSACK